MVRGREDRLGRRGVAASERAERVGETSIERGEEPCVLLRRDAFDDRGEDGVAEVGIDHIGILSVCNERGYQSGRHNEVGMSAGDRSEGSKGRTKQQSL